MRRAFPAAARSSQKKKQSFAQLGRSLRLVNSGWSVRAVPRSRSGNRMDTYVISPEGFRFCSKPELVRYANDNFRVRSLPRRAFVAKPGGDFGITCKEAIDLQLVTPQEAYEIKRQG